MLEFNQKAYHGSDKPLIKYKNLWCTDEFLEGCLKIILKRNYFSVESGGAGKWHLRNLLKFLINYLQR